MAETNEEEGWHHAVDVLVFGAGAAGMTAALVARLEGLDVLVCEKSGQVGGTTATSAGTIWVPGTSQSERAGLADPVENAAAYLDAVIGPDGAAGHRDALLRSGRRALDDLEARSEVVFAPAPHHPDYIANQPGAARAGRALVPLPFDGRRLGADFVRVRPPRPEFMVLGGMMVGKSDVQPLLHPLASWTGFRHAATLVLRHARDRLRFRRGTRLIMGNALVARLLFSLRRESVALRFDTRLVDLIVRDGMVSSATVRGPDGESRIRARRGVVLATGGIGWNAALRERLFPAAVRLRSLVPPEVSGDGLDAAARAGAALDTAHRSPAFWMPVSVLRRPGHEDAVWPHIMLDRAKPGLVAVNSAGRRFVNEADSYHAFVEGMLRSHETVPTMPAYLVCDARFLRIYGLGLVRPGARSLAKFRAAGYLQEARSLKDLAAAIGVDAANLLASVDAYNRSAETGRDEAFGRGESELNRFNGDAAHRPNPCLAPIVTPPFYAVAVMPADLGSSAGLATDAEGRVLDGAGVPIRNLLAVGNDMASVMRGAYPGPGTTLGPALVFAWRAALRLAGKDPDSLEHVRRS